MWLRLPAVEVRTARGRSEIICHLLIISQILITFTRTERFRVLRVYVSIIYQRVHLKTSTRRSCSEHQTDRKRSE